MADWVYISKDIKLHDGFMENMKEVLYAAERHAVVFGQPIEDNESLIKTAREYLPAYSLTDTVNGDCIIIKQYIIDLFGTPDVSNGSLKETLIKYCEKLNGYGFPSVIAYHALYTPDDGYKQAEITSDESSPFVHFLTLLDDNYHTKKRILFECSNMPCTHNGTTETMINSFEAFSRLFGDKYDIFFYTKREAAQYHGLIEKYDNILYPDTISGTFHLGFSPVQLMWYEPQLILNKHCLKIALQILDIIIGRCREYTVADAKSNIEMGVRISDGVTFISNYSKDDFFSCYANELPDMSGRKVNVIYVAKGDIKPRNDDYEIAFDKYFLITGNNLKHKALSETIEVTAGTKHNYIVIGTEKTGYVQDNVYGFESGQLDEDFVNYLYSHCKAVIFPSLYEGFGLPALMGLKNGKYVIVHDNSLNREMQSHFKEFERYFLFFNKFEQIADIVNNTGFDIHHQGQAPVYNDSWDRVAIELEAFFAEILSSEADKNKLKERRRICKHIEALMEEPVKTIADLCVHNNLQHEHMVKLDRQAKEAEHALERMLGRFGDYKLTSMMRFAIEENVKNRHPKLAGRFKRS